MEHTVYTRDLQKMADDIIDATEPLAKFYPEKLNEFLKVLVGIYRRNLFTLVGIRYLTNRSKLGDSALDLARKMIEDTVSVEWMILKGKEEKAKQFQGYLSVQLNRDLEFMRALGVDPATSGLNIDVGKVEKDYEKVKREFTHYSGKGYWQSWAKTNVEQMIEELSTKGAFDEWTTSRVSIGYILGCWKNHLNPHDVIVFLDGDIHIEASEEATRQALVFGTTCMLRLTTRYIDEIRFAYGKNEFEDIAKKVKDIFDRMNADA